MKTTSCFRLKLIISLFFVSLITWFTACQQGSENSNSVSPVSLKYRYDKPFDKLLLGQETTNDFIILTQALELPDDGLLLPKGTRIFKDKSDPEGGVLFTLPEGYKLVGNDPSGARLLAGGKINCKCTKGSGCSPYIASLGNKVSKGCAMSDGCTTCLQTVSAFEEGEQKVAMTDLDIVNFNDELHFVVTKEEFVQLKSPTTALMNLPEVKKSIADFVSGYQKDDLAAVRNAKTSEELPANYTYIPLSVYGRVILVPVQANITLAASPIWNQLLKSAPNGRIAAASCKCESGSSGCKLTSGSILVGQAKWCEAGRCTSCSLYY
ncbi:hypothetical protein ACO2Q8_24850 [Larkinella sp. VNQ87]|uniref:hypothetical protein n=1 Tax=Larkinella sp. VNQ87 TaxID=3400921 RepID=UPI003C03DD0B